MRRAAQSITLACFLAASATASMAATYTESLDGDLSNTLPSPTVLGTGIDGVAGSIPGGDIDSMAFTDLGNGPQSLTVVFSTSNTGASINVLVKENAPIMNQGDGFFAPVNPQPGQPVTLVIPTSASFMGTFYVGFIGNSGDTVYNMDLPTTSPIPLPASAVFMLAGIGGLAALARRKRRAS